VQHFRQRAKDDVNEAQAAGQDPLCLGVFQFVMVLNITLIHKCTCNLSLLYKEDQDRARFLADSKADTALCR
jgi:hypothetical protein